MSRPLRLVWLLVLALSTTCSGKVENHTRAPTGLLRIVLHDAPHDAVDEVWVTFDQISVRSAADGWVVVDDRTHTVDLKTLQNGVVQTLGLVRLPVGHYTEIRLHVSTAHVVVGGSEHPLDIPSGDSSGIKVKADFEVPVCGVVQVTLDWDLDTNLHGHQKGGYTLRSTIQVDDPVLDDRACCGDVLCAGGVCNDGVCEPGGGEQLVVHDAEPELVRGYFGRDGVSLAFLIQDIGGTHSVTITSAAGERLIEISMDGSVHRMSLFDGAVTTTLDLAIMQESFDLEGLPPGEAPSSFSLAGAMVTTGDTARANELPTRPEYPLLPWLSRALGGAGVNGVDFPVSLPLHRMAMEAENELELVLPPLPMTKRAATEGTRGEGAGTTNPASPFCDSLADDPCGNECLGMCGPGCSCKWWICGDCCCHLGCLAHDHTCRAECSWWRPWNCILCKTFLSFFAGGCLPCFGLGGCDDTPGGAYEPPCTSLGEICYADYECCGSDSGAGEGRRPFGNSVICEIGPSGDGRCERERPYVPPVCGDDTCEETESCASCFDDCGPCAGDCDDDGTCDGYPEDCGTCAGDCPCAPGTHCSGRQCVDDGGGGGSCGDGSCGVFESCSTCPADCGPCGGGCGDGACGGGENCSTCAADCGPCPPGCGDGTCAPGVEDNCNCPVDCPPVCGNGTCDCDETCATCPSDCGSCGVVCGDGSCEPVLEDCGNCPGDCPCWMPGTTCIGGQCHTYCGNGTCEPFVEDNCNCPTDCPPVCGNGTCDCAEDCFSCPSECGSCSFCGDGSCDFPEDACNCSIDCGFCFP